MAALVSSQGWFVPVTTSQAFSLWDNQTYFWAVTFPGLGAWDGLCLLRLAKPLAFSVIKPTFGQ